MTKPIAVVGMPTALGGHIAGMERTPSELRQRGLLDQLVAAGLELRDDGDLGIEPGFRPDPDRRAKNRAQIAEFLPRQAAMVAASVAEDERLLILGGDCTAHAGAVAGLRRARLDRQLAIAWFDAHGDFNTPDTTPSGNVWGMPFAMLCGRGDADLVAACDGPTVVERHAALIGGQVLDEVESRVLAASPIAHFGAGMLGTPAGMAALAAWATAVGREVDGLYVAIDHDVLDGVEGWALQMPEAAGISLATALEAVATLAAAMPVVGYGATAMNFAAGDGPKTVAAAAELAIAAFG
ncbi:MAG: arginase family protein [Candidatus Limnocylindrales bacterium]